MRSNRVTRNTTLIANEKKANPIFIKLGALNKFYCTRLINGVHRVFVFYIPICLKPQGDAVICLGVSDMTTPWTLVTKTPTGTDIVKAKDSFYETIF